MKHDNTIGGIIFDCLNYLFLAALGVITLLPFVHIFASSVATNEEWLNSIFLLIPRTFTLDSYKFIFSSPTMPRSLLVSAGITVIGTLVNLFFTLTMAYPLAKKYLPGRKYFMGAVVFTMLFGGGMIPNFIIVQKLGLINSYASLILPGAINTFNLIVIKNFFQELPAELEESATIDGCNEIQVLLRIILPLSLPVIATFTLFYAVVHWNSFFNAIIYINDSKKWPVQVILRQVVVMAEGGAFEGQETQVTGMVFTQGVKMAVIVVATLPILCVYPFLQKYFVKGVLMGSVKG